MGTKSLEQRGFGNIATNKIATLNQIGFQDVKEREALVTTKDVEARREAVENFSKWAMMEEIS